MFCLTLSEAIKSMAHSSERMWKPQHLDWACAETALGIRIFNPQKLCAVGMCGDQD